MALDQAKIPTLAQLEAQNGPNTIQLKPVQSMSGKDIPALLSQTFHPKWVRDDHEPIYAATPFFTVTFVE